MEGLNCSPMQQIKAIKAHTTGAARALVDSLQAASGADPAQAVTRIWDTLEERYGSPARVANALIQQLENLAYIRNGPTCGPSIQRLYDHCRVVLAHLPGNRQLGVLDLADGQRRIWSKWPDQISQRWRKHATRYRRTTHQQDPPFAELVDFLGDLADEYCHEHFLPQTPKTNASHVLLSQADGRADL